MDSETVEVGSTFPAPPSQYKYFSQDNLDLLEGLPTDIPATKEAFVEWYNKTKGEDIDVDLRTTLVKPRVDWILEDGYYSAYGELWPVSRYYRMYNLSSVFIAQRESPIAERERCRATIPR